MVQNVVLKCLIYIPVGEGGVYLVYIAGFLGKNKVVSSFLIAWKLFRKHELSDYALQEVFFFFSHFFGTNEEFLIETEKNKFRFNFDYFNCIMCLKR